MPNTFGEKLKKLRESNVKLQQDMALLLDISIRQYQRYEKGEQEPNIDTLIKIADFYNVSLDYLVGRTDNPDSHKNN